MVAGQSGAAASIRDRWFGAQSTSAALTADLQPRSAQQAGQQTGSATPSASASTSASASPLAKAAGRAHHHRVRTISLARGKTYGPVGGRVVLKAPIRLRGAVVFTLTGPSSVKLLDRRAPYAVTLDAGRLAAGTYTVTVAAEKTRSTTGKVKGKELTATIVVAHPTKPPVRITPVKPVPTTSTSGAAPRPITTAPTPTTPAPTKTIPTSPRPTATPTAKPPVATQPAPAVPPSSAEAAEVVRLTNAQRAANGCRVALTINPRLTASAQGHSADMAAKNYFSHTSLDGRSPFDRMKAAGYSYRAAGENIAGGQRTPAAVMDAWMNSDGHRQNILNCTFTEIGVGVAQGGRYGIYWTQNFGTPAR